MAKGKKLYTILFLPEGNGKTISLHVYRHIVYSFILFVAVFLIGFFGLILKSGEIAAKLQLVNALRTENRKLEEDNNKLNYVRAKVEKIEFLSEYLRKIATVAGADSLADAAFFQGENGFEAATAGRRDAAQAAAGADKQTGIIPKEFLLSVPNIQPTEGWITRKFSASQNDSEQPHPGVDFAAAAGTPVRATAKGVVTDICKDPYLGLMVTVNHGHGFLTKYGHCAQVLAIKGACVARGQTIALVGNTGRSSAPHLHYEVLKDGKNIDPMEYIIKSQK